MRTQPITTTGYLQSRHVLAEAWIHASCPIWGWPKLQVQMQALIFHQAIQQLQHVPVFERPLAEQQASLSRIKALRGPEHCQDNLPFNDVPLHYYKQAHQTN